MRLVQNVQIVIILRDILINFPDFIETLTMTMTITITNLTEHILSPLIRGGSKAGIFNEGRKTKDEERKTKAYFVATKSRIVFRRLIRLIKPNRGAAYFVATKSRIVFRSKLCLRIVINNI